MPRYSAWANQALSTTIPFLAWTGTASYAFNTLDILLGGQATASAANNVTLGRCTGAGTTPVAVTMSPLHSSSLAAGVVCNNSYGAGGAPTAGVVLLYLPVNGNGGIVRWLAAPGEEIFSQGAATPAGQELISQSGTSNVSGSVVVDQL